MGSGVWGHPMWGHRVTCPPIPTAHLHSSCWVDTEEISTYVVKVWMCPLLDPPLCPDAHPCSICLVGLMNPGRLSPGEMLRASEAASPVLCSPMTTHLRGSVGAVWSRDRAGTIPGSRMSMRKYTAC